MVKNISTRWLTLNTQLESEPDLANLKRRLHWNQTFQKVGYLCEVANLGRPEYEI